MELISRFEFGIICPVPNKNVVVDPETISEETIKTGPQVNADDDFSDIIDIINKNREKTVSNDFGDKY